MQLLWGSLTFQKDATGLMFPGRNSKQLGAWQLSKLASNLDLGGTVHGFRASFRMWAADVGIAREVAEACLAHQVANAAERAYARSDLLERRREVMDEWSNYVAVHKLIRRA